MPSSLNRRDFLRLAGLLPLGLAAPRWTRRLAAGDRPNILILVFDALSALHLPLYGYPRQTMPNLARLAERAIVYHNHYAGSSFTTPGTASLLTGTLPWTHRAIRGGGRVAEAAVPHNLFEAFGDMYRLGYSHNSWVEILLRQFASSLEELIPRDRLYLGGSRLSPVGLFPADDDIATVAWTRYIDLDEGHAYSLFASTAGRLLEQAQRDRYARLFPEGLPGNAARQSFLMEDAVGWFGARLPQLPQPFLGYLHFLPPHAPYRPPEGFYGRFAHDGLQFARKPIDIFHSPVAPVDQSRRRELYDEFLLYADRAFGALYDSLEAAGRLENTWLVFTSDHGEMFERGILEHGGEALYDPIVRVPLLIFEPGRRQRLDIHEPTSAADVLPTLAQVTGHAAPAWVEGRVLPPFGPPDAQRPVYAVLARQNDPNRALTVASTMLVRGSRKLLYYFGYPVLEGSELVKLYDVESDPEEMNDLSTVEKDAAATLLQELKGKIAEVNRPYPGGG